LWIWLFVGHSHNWSETPQSWNSAAAALRPGFATTPATRDDTTKTPNKAAGGTPTRLQEVHCTRLRMNGEVWMEVRSHALPAVLLPEHSPRGVHRVRQVTPSAPTGDLVHLCARCHDFQAEWCRDGRDIQGKRAARRRELAPPFLRCHQAQGTKEGGFTRQVRAGSVRCLAGVGVTLVCAKAEPLAWVSLGWDGALHMLPPYGCRLGCQARSAHWRARWLLAASLVCVGGACRVWRGMEQNWPLMVMARSAQKWLGGVECMD
jgi:hypothetical protein